MIEYHDLVSRIKNCINRKQEGSSWDFKKQWYSNNSDLLHDIICMSNLLEKEDGLIVIGVDESADYALTDVRNDSNRKRTQDLVCLLREKNLPVVCVLLYLYRKFEYLAFTWMPSSLRILEILRII